MCIRDRFCPLHEVLQCDEATINAQIDFTTGASMLVRREVLEQAGLIPEEYFLYYEDVDYGISLKKAGFNLVWARNSIVHHHDGSSTRKQGDGAPAWVDFLILRNRLYFIKKHFPMSVPSAILGYAGVVFNRIRRGQAERLKNTFPAIADALRGKMGMSDRARRIAQADVQAQKKSSEKTCLTFSLIVATCNRVAPLENLLQSLRNQSHRQFETIIVDQNPEGFLDQLLATFADLDLKVILIAPEGVSNARNVGLLQATKDVVALSLIHILCAFRISRCSVIRPACSPTVSTVLKFAGFQIFSIYIFRNFFLPPSEPIVTQPFSMVRALPNW